ncbi:hypothetical protein [Streptomyces chattanoogensis]|uniref:Membrane protein n=1 Tax=Streptomyces chattanoogensis TaxID=66876 RepID=A0A0N0XXB9_9ACTN|nr:hypothetical protein [Streptomyces chattanoogensis]KPC62307.1 membrane protein [Streptomyces chattanoogensis]
MSFGQGGPFDGPGGNGTPDWGALAEESEAASRRKRWMLIGGGALAALAVAGIVTVAVISSGGDSPNGNPTARPTASGEVTPDDKPSFPDYTVPPPPNPRDYISDPKKDRAPLTPATLFPDKSMVIGEHTYPRTNTATTGDCTSASQGPLGSLLSHNGCTKLLRATYSKGGVSATVGVAVFTSPAQATKVMNQWKGGNITPLAGGGVPSAFCQGTRCRTTANATGRYAYFTIAGYNNGKATTTSETKAQAIGRDGASYAFARITQRGKDQAQKAAEKQAEEARRKAEQQQS